jgi:hypothetical protein
MSLLSISAWFNRGLTQVAQTSYTSITTNGSRLVEYIRGINGVAPAADPAPFFSKELVETIVHEESSAAPEPSSSFTTSEVQPTEKKGERALEIKLTLEEQRRSLKKIILTIFAIWCVVTYKVAGGHFRLSSIEEQFSREEAEIQFQSTPGAKFTIQHPEDYYPKGMNP